MTQARQLALYTTVYPGVERFLSAWYESVLAQTDRRFDLWIGSDGLGEDAVAEAIGRRPSATWITADQGDSPARLREKVIARMITVYPAIVFVDSDDLLAPTRVEAARMALEEGDVAGCAMRLIGEDGEDLNLLFRPPDGVDPTAILPTKNVFGLSNTAYRSVLLRRCLPLPARCELVDWFLATCAWALGARFAFDRTFRMAYRQHACNIARVLPPFSPEMVKLATGRVLEHYALILKHVPELRPHQRAELEAARARVMAFSCSISTFPDILGRYVSALNELSTSYLWWEWVAHPQLEELWRR